MVERSRAVPPLRWRLRHILPYYRENLRAFVFGFLLLVATSASAALIPYLMKLATEALSQPQPGESMQQLVLALIVVAVGNALLRIWSRTHIFAIGRQVEYALRKSYHGKLLSLDAAFFNRSKTGDLVARGNTDVLAVRMFIGPGFLQVANTAMVYAVTLPVMIALNPTLTLLALLPFPIILGLTRLLTTRLYRLSRAVADRFGLFSGFVQEAVAGMAVIRAHAREEDWQRRFAAEVEEIYTAQMRHTRLQSLFGPLVLLAGGAGIWIILLVGGQEVMARQLTVGDFVAFAGYLAILVWPTVGFGWILTVLQRGLAALERIGQVLDTEPFALLPAQQQQVLPQAPPCRAALVVRDLHFAHHEPILQGIDLLVPPGSFIGLAGRIGCGKSTLLHCLARLYAAPAGTIFLDARDLLAVPEQELRQRVALAQQESFLFSATIRDNMSLGRPQASEEEIWQAAEMACFAEEIRHFPEQLDTLVGERGITLSGGQRQRLSLARALLMDPDVLLLDDIFSSVDARTEARILDNIHALADTRQRTIILVCHRTAALHRAEAIYVLEQGKIAAQGTHEQLMASSELYASLHQQMIRHEALESLQ
ncbi:ABC transporter ATP-binding protein [Candidatus Magnetaquicoccus inordinatus]|uniref:ABC transporter ATP-binding protein n=1 Tax=Candidatus Magnetaquicoccus inordinatus TaxID=2496818 RepID=UPI00102CDF59|nr:ABC transporter ATP-binding protein [Candidatus Magnetaquicoccus inordinatus]